MGSGLNQKFPTFEERCLSTEGMRTLIVMLTCLIRRHVTAIKYEPGAYLEGIFYGGRCCS